MQSLTPTYTKAHITTHGAVMTVRGGRGEGKQGQISSDSEGRQLHILISLHFRFLLLNFYLICGTSPPSIPSQPPYVPLRLPRVLVTSRVHSAPTYVTQSKRENARCRHQLTHTMDT